MIRVSAGVCLKNGRILVCKRGEGRKNAHLWEFPGGKQEKRETPESCLCRELMEELSLPVSHVRPLVETEAEGIRFTFLRCDALGDPVPTEHEDMGFVLPRALLTLPFCLADAPIARAIALNAPPLTHFFWDLDGTVMDTYPTMVQAFLTAARTLGVEADPQRVLALMKRSLSDCVAHYAATCGVNGEALLQGFRAAETNVSPAAVKPVSGMPDTLARLSALGGHHYLVTHRDRSARRYLEAAGLEGFFTDMVTAEDGFPRKPCPDSIRHLLTTHRILPETAVMIGDRPLDAEAGHAAGIVSCLLDEENRFPTALADVRVHHASELPDALCPPRILLDESTQCKRSIP